MTWYTAQIGQFATFVLLLFKQCSTVMGTQENQLLYHRTASSQASLLESLHVGSSDTYSGNLHSENEYRLYFEKWKRENDISFKSQTEPQSLSGTPSRYQATVSEDDVRMKLFADRFDRLERLQQKLDNKSPGETTHFKVGLNGLAALTDDELVALRGFQKSEKIEKVFSGGRRLMDELSVNGVPVKMHPRKTRDIGNLPAEVDWRLRGVVTDVKSQGECGGCWAFTATGAIESLFAIESGVLISLSEQQLLECDNTGNNLGCQGGNYYYAFQYNAREMGNALATSEQYPYKNDINTHEECNRDGKVGVVESSHVIYFVDRSEEALMEAVAQQPVAVAISGYTEEFMFYSGGILDTLNCGSEVDHAVLIVGYGSSDEGDYWIIKNSWGTSWGEKGFGRIARNNPAVTKATDGFGQCGILYQANYLATATCAVDDCEKHSSRQFCTVEFGCLNATTPYSDIIPDGTFIRTVPRDASTVMSNPIALAVIISGVLAGSALLAVSGLYVHEKYIAPPTTLNHFQDTEDLFGFNKKNINKEELERDPTLRCVAEMDEKEKQRKYEKLSKQFFKMVGDNTIAKKIVVRYLNGTDGDVRAAAKLYLGETNGTNRWI